MATYAAKLRPSAVDGQTIRVLPDGRIRGNAGMEPFSGGTLGGAPSVFYADGNVVSSGNGLSWLSAVKTLAEALALAHAYMGTSGNRAWAQRATVYCCADNFTEDLTKFAEKTDVIGVGSTNQFSRARIEGTHVLEAQATEGYLGCHWYNVEWYGAAAGIIVDIPANQNGQGFYDCVWQSTDGATIGLRGTQAHDLQVIDCRFIPNTSGTGFATAAIQIAAGSCTNMLIKDSFIYSGGIGLDFNCTAGQPINCVIEDCNLVCPAGMAIDEESDDLWVMNNRWVCEGVAAGSTYDLSATHSVNNIATGNDGTDEVPFRKQA